MPIKIKRRNFVLYAVLGCSLALVAGSSIAEEETIDWVGTYAEAIEEAKRTGKPIFLEFRCEP